MAQLNLPDQQASPEIKEKDSNNIETVLRPSCARVSQEGVEEDPLSLLLLLVCVSVSE